MTKQLIALVRLAGLCYRILLTFTEYLDHLPWERLNTALELFIRWMEAQVPPLPVVGEAHGGRSLNAEVETFSHASAAHFLDRCEKQVHRYRNEGRLPFTRDTAGRYRYLKADLELLFEQLHGFPKGGFRK